MADKYWPIKFAVNKASSNAGDILDAFLNFTVIVVFVPASWLQEYKAKGCILATLRASCFLWVQDSYIPVGSKVDLSLACCGAIRAYGTNQIRQRVGGLVLRGFFFYLFFFKVSKSMFLAPIVAVKSYRNDLC